MRVAGKPPSSTMLQIQLRGLFYRPPFSRQIARHMASTQRGDLPPRPAANGIFVENDLIQGVFIDFKANILKTVWSTGLVIHIALMELAQRIKIRQFRLFPYSVQSAHGIILHHPSVSVA